MALVLAVTHLAAAQPKRILLVHSFGPNFGPWNAISARMREEVRKQSPYPIDFYETSLQGERLGEGQNEGSYLDYLNGLFEGRNLDLILAMGAPAARFMLRNRARLFPSKPMLIAGADERTFRDSQLTPNDTAVSVTFDQSIQLQNILEVLPDTTDIAIAIGDSPLEQFWVADLRRSFQRFETRVTLHWLNKLSAEEMVKRVLTLPPSSAIYYATVRIDASGEPQEEDRVLARLHDAGRSPIFTYIDTDFGRGIVGGRMLSAQDIAQQSAAVGVRLLHGESPASIKIAALGLSAPKYDWRELKRWRINEASLPSGSIVQFRQPTVWQTYRWQILLLSAAILVQAAMIMVLLYEHRRRRVAEVTARTSMSELMQMNRIATAGELSASIAHEVNQPLTGISARASAAVRWLAKEPPDIEKVRNMLREIVNASDRAADIVSGVRAMFKKDSKERSAVDINKLSRTVLDIVRVELQKNGVELQTALSEGLPTVECDPVQLQQVILNLVMNAIEAMQAVQPRVLRIESKFIAPHAVRVVVQDTGKGVDPLHLDRIFRPLVTTKERGMGMGLSIC
ncbi:MAG TPA: ATP-binding protein, partial [Xanthobacteraceae bacterium]|nr:ATP-binding protein [Xanthobacteraceae bacterium]